jgi:hypothetical protein
MRKVFATLFILMIHFFAIAQKEEVVHYDKIRGGIMMANSHIPQVTEEQKSIAIIPTWGIEIDYRFHKRWCVGFETDIKLQSYDINDNGVELLRKYPISTALVLHYFPISKFSFYTGFGQEYASQESLLLLKFGAEYNFEISERFEIGLNLVYEDRFEVYDGITFGISFNKVLNKKHTIN